MPLERKSIVPNDVIESILKPVVLANLGKRKQVTGSKDRGTQAVVINGEIVHIISDRYKTFFTKGFTCVNCGIIGTRWALERHVSHNGKIDPNNNPDGRYHLNLYAIKDGKEILMTKDHIVPVSLGGKNYIDNYQPMCTICNQKKGNNNATSKTQPSPIWNSGSKYYTVSYACIGEI